MANVGKLGVPLTPEMLAIVREAVGSGDYASSSDVMRDALREWKRRRALEQKDVEELALLVDSLRRSLKPPQPQIDTQWATEAKRRLSGRRSAKVEAVPGVTVFEHVWGRFKQCSVDCLTGAFCTSFIPTPSC
jgi:Arc/MetJ-type ribon-helix-helix transcriptional regulator